MGATTARDWLRQQLGRQLWVRPTIASLLSVGMASGAYWVGRSFDAKVDFDIDEPALVSLLSIFASSMLSVATFTVAAIVTAASSASNSTTPRASRLILADNKAQIVLSAFIAAFIHSIVAIFALKAFHYGNSGRFLLFVGLIVLVAFVLVSFINWVDHAMKLGRQSNTIGRLTDAALDCITAANVGTWGARMYDGGPPVAALDVASPEIGYVTAIDLAKLQSIADDLGSAVYLTVRPGGFIDMTTAIAHVSPASEAVRDRIDDIATAFRIDPQRDYGADVRFGFVNLAETADRALSPGINDPGTAITILGRQLQLMARWAEAARQAGELEIVHDRVFVPPLKAVEIVRDSFTPIARDGAGAVEVGIRLQKTLASVARLGDAALREVAVEMSRVALQMAEASLVADAHKDLVRKAAAGVGAA